MQFLAGTYTENTSSEGLYCFGLGNASEPYLEPLSLDLVNPSFLCAHPFLAKVYVVEETGSDFGGGRVSCLSPNQAALIHSEKHATGGNDPCHLDVSPDGRWLAVANYSSGSVALFSLSKEGEIDQRQGSITHLSAFEARKHESGRHLERQEAPHAHFVKWIDASSLLICDLGNDEVYCYEGDPSGLSESEEPVEQPGQNHGSGFVCSRRWRFPRGSGPRHAAFSSDGQRFWVLAELSNEVYVCDYKTEAVGASVSTLPHGCHVFSEAAEIEFNARRSELWVSNRGLDDVVCFDASNPAHLTVKGRWATGAHPRHFIWSEDCLLIASRDPGKVEMLTVTSEMGQDQRANPLEIPAVVCLLPIHDTVFGTLWQGR